MVKRESNKVVKGAKHQKRPSASFYYNELNMPIGTTISYRPRKSGKYILHSLELRKNKTPYWKSLEKLPKRNKKTNSKTKRSNKTKKNKSKTKRNKSVKKHKTKKRTHVKQGGG